MAMYEYTIDRRSTATHGNADAMSRLPLPESQQVNTSSSENESIDGGIEHHSNHRRKN